LIKKIHIKKIAQLTGHNASIFALTNGKDKHHFRSAAGDGWVAEWNLQSPENGQLIAKVDTQIFSICNIENQNRLVVGNMNGGAHWVDLNEPEATKNIQHHQKGIFGIIQIGDYLYTTGGSGILTKWDIASCRTIESLHLTNQSLRGIDYSKKRNEIAVGASDHAIYLLDATTLEIRKKIEKAHDNSVFSVRYHPNNQWLLSGGRDAHLKVWDLENQYENISSQPAHWFTINDLVFHPKGHLFATGSRDKTVKIWDATTFQLLKVMETIRDNGHLNSVNALHWSNHNDWLISGSDDRSLIIWEVFGD